MQIWFDLRFLKKADHYSNFIFKLVQVYINNERNNKYKLYLDLAFSHLNFWENTQNILVTDSPWSIREQKHFLKILKNDKNDLMVFFIYKKPILYKWKNIVFLWDLSDFHYPSKKNVFRRYVDNYLLNKNSSLATNIICFNEITKNEINDKLNISDEKIKVLTPFFDKKEIKKIDNLNIDIKTKYNIIWDYFIYNAWVGIHKNLDRLVEVFEIMKNKSVDINLLIIDEDSIKDIAFRRLVLNNNLQDKIIFLWNISPKESPFFYENSIWVIYPYLYESFPFSMEEALSLWITIISSDLKNIVSIFGNKINYIETNSISKMFTKIFEIYKKWKTKTHDYENIFTKYSIANTYKEFSDIINKI